ncbi:hypothetical protein OG339_01670 [Streptosporangium sp. NBC_01495]|uniref:hypothetical protein n=1 Tax=Streptosporangium sp. NBC_01495 TaxID=2903899 RepID=UPI002E302EB6|nr:hypothetical protein [Streptosporangium sp. NBC_01495]
MRYSLRRFSKFVAALAVAGSVSMISASPAEAASATCVVAGTSCKTGNVKASSAHWIQYYWDSGLSAVGCSMRVVDVANGAIVYAGRVGIGSHKNGYIYGLYGTYRMELYNCSTGAVGYIKNTVI